MRSHGYTCPFRSSTTSLPASVPATETVWTVWPVVAVCPSSAVTGCQNSNASGAGTDDGSSVWSKVSVTCAPCATAVETSGAPGSLVPTLVSVWPVKSAASLPARSRIGYWPRV